MTVQGLINDLSRFPDNARVVFTPKDHTGGGWPEWHDAYAAQELAYGIDLQGKEVQVPTGAVIVTLTGELE